MKSFLFNVRKLIVGSALSVAIFIGCLLLAGRAANPVSTLTPVEGARIRAALKGVDPKTYRVVLPVAGTNGEVHNEVYGSLPLSQVKMVASRRGITFNERSQIHGVLSDDNSAGGGGGGDKNGPGSHTESGSGAKALQLELRIREILARVDKGQYILVQ